MISDPDPEVRRMLVRIVARLGYEPMVVDDFPTPAKLRSADVLLVEPTSPDRIALTRTARAANPTLAIISEGAATIPTEIDRDDGPVAHLAKPFTIEQLDGALQRAIVPSDRPRRATAGGNDVQPSMTPKSCV
jgi:CheY-like chemotaxis protein